MKITESQLRNIIRGEAKRLLEAPTFVRPGPDLSDPDVDHFSELSDPTNVAIAIVGELGAEGAEALYAAVMEGDHTADQEFQDYIEQFSDGTLDAGDEQVQNEVLDALAAELDER